ncbi:MAG: LysR family transcriptional regulator [Caulobacterales bacterium]
MQGSTDQDDLWRRLDWDDVRIFLAVAESGSLNAAARALGMTQPTISRRMEDLEIRLGARLFNRSSRGICLTPSGETMHDLAAGMARLGGAIVRDVAGRDRVDEGRVRLAAPDGMASFVLMPTFGEFQRTNPQIQLSLDCGLWPNAPMGDGVDLSLEFTESGSPDMVSTPIATLHYAYYASRDYINFYGAPATFAEVAQHRVMHHAAYKEQLSTWNRKAIALLELNGNHLVTNSSAALVLAIARGAGIGSLPTLVETLGMDLVMLELEPVAHPVLWLRHHSAAVRQGRVQRVKEWIQRAFDPTDKPWFRDEYIHPRDFSRAVGRPNVEPIRAKRA